MKCNWTIIGTAMVFNTVKNNETSYVITLFKVPILLETQEAANPHVPAEPAPTDAGQHWSWLHARALHPWSDRTGPPLPFATNTQS
eukprot:2555989-Amphidinium_carterae.1